MKQITNIIVPVAIMFSVIVAVWINLAAYHQQIQNALRAVQSIIFGWMS